MFKVKTDLLCTWLNWNAEEAGFVAQEMRT